MIETIIDEHFGNYSVVRADYLEITGDACAAQILHSMEHWTAYKFTEIERVERLNAEAIKNGLQPIPVPDVWLYEKIQNFVDAICGTFKRNKVIEALKLLKSKGFIESKPSLIPKDQTLLYKFNIDEIEEALRKAKASKGFAAKRRTKSQSLNSNAESLDSDSVQSLNLNRQSLDSDSVQSLNSDSDPLYNSIPIIQGNDSIKKDPLTPQGGTGCLSEGGGEIEKPKPEGLGNQECSPKPPVATTTLETIPSDKPNISGENQKPPAPAPKFSVHNAEHLEAIKRIYNSGKPKLWQPINNFYQHIKLDLESVISSDDFKGDLGAFLTRLENALSELSNPSTQYSWFAHQGNLGLKTLLNGYGKHLKEISDAWTERQKPQTQANEALPDWLVEAYAEMEQEKLKKAG